MLRRKRTGEIYLVVQDKRLCAKHLRPVLLIAPGQRNSMRRDNIMDHQHDVRAFRSRQRATNTLLLNRARSLAKSGGIAQHERVAIQIQRNFDHIARGAWLIVNDGCFPASERIQQARLSGIRRADNRDLDAFAQESRPGGHRPERGQVRQPTSAPRATPH